MKQTSLTRAVILSCAVHGLLLGTVAVVALYRAPIDTLGGGGMGGSVVVSFVGDGGSSGSGSMEEAAATTGGGAAKKPALAKTGKKMNAPAAMGMKGIASTPQASAEGTHADGNDATGAGSGALSAGSGGGAGGGHGGGIGPGRGKGNPVLSQIWRKINRSKYYPRLAKKNGWEGSPRVKFAITKFGEVQTVELAKSCGIPELDQAALETVRRSSPLPHYPKPITLAIRYSVRE